MNIILCILRVVKSSAVSMVYGEIIRVLSVIVIDYERMRYSECERGFACSIVWREGNVNSYLNVELHYLMFSRLCRLEKDKKFFSILSQYHP